METDETPGAPRVLHQLECTTCPAQSACHEQQVPALDWAFDHIKRHPDHRGYREVVTKFWRMTPLDKAELQQP
ncbi:DUF7848 domain-containing protein [Streptomyces alkaliphilus]|uniref:DUF7848 domain-containing protein n=1 Tax=Streptomyces alkaliphilus TaxID=1472722 RepID=UPI001180D929|nr:hypothetical protein [Streptomyces alkaliphilus]MQS06108.1 hypothetical protein [Streptomyces alkaliphilus]